MPTNSKVGVSDIAKHAGVSIGTVSNYLNYPERVSETLKAKIGAAIQELGYHAVTAPANMGGEDFAYYLLEKPGCYWHTDYRLCDDRHRAFAVLLHF